MLTTTSTEEKEEKVCNQFSTSDSQFKFMKRTCINDGNINDDAYSSKDY